MLKAVADANVRHGYTPVFALYPAINFAKAITEEGRIGSVCHMEFTMCGVPRMDEPFGWKHRLADGGGALNTLFTHLLLAVVRLSSARVVAAGGIATTIVKRLAAGTIHHDTRDAMADSIDITRPNLQWQKSDTDDVFSVFLRLQLPI